MMAQIVSKSALRGLEHAKGIPGELRGLPRRKQISQNVKVDLGKLRPQKQNAVAASLRWVYDKMYVKLFWPCTSPAAAFL